MTRRSRFLAPSGLRGLLALLLCLFLLCAPTPAVRADMQFGMGFGVEDERELGEKFNLLIRSSMPLIEDPEVTGYVEDLVASLVAVMPQLNFDITTGVIRNNSLNAFAGPAGYLFVHSGLILNLDSESELAGVLAHELAHVSQRHLAERIESAQSVSLLAIAGILAGMVLGSQMGEDGRSLGEGLAVGSMAAAQTAMLSYSREDERDADNVGLNYLVDAGYNPKGLLSAMEIIQRWRWIQGGDIPPYLTTHPGVEERIGYLETRVEQYPAEALDRPHDDTRFLRVQTLIRARYTDAESALTYFQSQDRDPCLAAMGRAIAHARLSQVGQASEAFDQAQSCMGDDPLLFREAGRLHFDVGDFPQASYYLQRALAKNPDDLMAAFYYARLLGEEGDTGNAAYYFERVLRSLPEDAEVHSFYGRVLGEGGHLFEAHLHLAYAALYGNDKQQADYHMDKAHRLAQNEEQNQAYDKLQEAYDARAEYW